MSSTKVVNGKHYILGQRYVNSRNESVLLRNQAPLTTQVKELVKYKRQDQTEFILYELIPVKTMTAEEYLSECENKTMYKNIK